MNKFKAISIILISIFSIFLFSCNNGAEPLADKDDVAYINISSKVSAAKSIVPTTDEFNISKLKDFELSGVWNGSETRTLLEADDWDGIFGSCPFAVQTGTWDFTLSASLNEAQYSGTINNKEIELGADPILLSFTLSPEAESYGGFNLMFNITSGSAALGEFTLSKNGTNITTQNIAVISNALICGRDRTDSSEQLEPGDYDVEVVFKNNDSEALSTWKGMVRVIAGLTTTAKIDWALNPVYSITYEDNGGSLLDTTFVRAETYTSKGSAVELPEMKKDGLVFDGWYESETFTGEAITEISSGTTGDKILYARFVAPYAYIGDIPYSSLSKLTAAITNASSTADITVSLTSNVSQADLGKAETSATIAYSISKTKAKSLSLVVPSTEEIELSGDCSYMFKNCSKLASVDFSGVDTSAATAIYGMFYGCSNLASVNLSGFDTSNVTSMMFMFAYCSKLVAVDLSNFNTSSATSIHGMFSDCTSLTDVNLSSFDTSQADSFSSMFANCTSLTQVDISSFTLRNDSVNAASMFYGCTNLETIYVSYGFDMTASTTDNSNMFNGCVKLVGGKGKTFDSEAIDHTYARFDTVSNPGYFTAKPLGEKTAPSALYDIVFADGSATAYSADLELTDKQKALAVGVVYNIDDSNGIPRGILGKIHTTDRLRWTTEGTAYKSDYDAGLQVTPSNTGYDVVSIATFEGDSDGSDNWSLICASYSGMSEDEILALHPVFEYVNNYAAANGLAGTEFENGWYLPSLPELHAFLKDVDTINPIINLINGTNFAQQEYWSSSLQAQSDSSVWIVGTANNEINSHGANDCDDNVCCVIQF